LKSRSKIPIRNALSRAEIVIGGSAPWDIQVHDSRFYDRVLTEGSLGLGESYELLKIRYANRQTIRKARRVAEQHDDLGNEFFQWCRGLPVSLLCAAYRAQRIPVVADRAVQERCQAGLSLGEVVLTSRLRAGDDGPRLA
jgi:hypothetical protein